MNIDVISCHLNTTFSGSGQKLKLKYQYVEEATQDYDKMVIKKSPKLEQLEMRFSYGSYTVYDTKNQRNIFSKIN